MDRSSRFESIGSDNYHMKTCFRYGPGGFLKQATAYESPVHSSTGMRSKPWCEDVRTKSHIETKSFKVGLLHILSIGFKNTELF